MQPPVRLYRVRPDCGAAIGRQLDGAQHADGGDSVDERHVGVPAIRHALLGIDRQDRLAVAGDRRVRLGDLAEERGEGQLITVGSVVLVTQEYHPVAEQGSPQFGDRRGRNLAADANAADDRTDLTADLGDLDVLEVAGCGQGYRAVQYLSHAPRTLSSSLHRHEPRWLRTRCRLPQSAPSVV